MKQKGFILFSVIIIIALIGAVGYLIYQNTQLKKGYIKRAFPTIVPTTYFSEPSPPSNLEYNWKKYKNDEFGFEISYPDKYNMTILKSIGKEVGITLTKPDSGVFHIEAIGTGIAYEDESFVDYVQHAASSEIQGYESPYSIQEFYTKSGIKGYKIKWNVTNLQGKHSVSSNFYYLPLNKKVTLYSQPVKSIQIWGDTSDEEVVDQISKTYNFN